MEDILFVTAYKEIGREQWELFPRSSEEYIQYFYNLVDAIEYKLVVYVEDKIRKIFAGHVFKDNIIIKDLNEVDTFYNKFIDKEREIISSEEYRRKIPESRSKYPEHSYAEYNLINHSKVNFIRHSRNLFPNYKFYSWIDFGFGQLDNGSMEANYENMPRDIAIETLPETHIIYCCVKDPPVERLSEDEMLASYDIYFMGTYFIVPNGLVEEFEKIWYSKLVYWQTIGISDDDQNLILQIYYDIPWLFCRLCINPILQANWFEMFRALRRQ